jgi:myosin heavy subunit
MVAMEILNEAEILNNLKIRYSSLEIFTYIGPTLLAM